MKTRRKLQILIAIVAVISGGFYFVRVHRYSKTVAVGKWQMNFSVPLMACPVCNSRVSRIEYDGQTIAMPQFPTNDGRRWRRTSLDTPLGRFLIDNHLENWRIYHGDGIRLEDSDIPITEKDLRRGYYVQEFFASSGPSELAPRKGTPPHWCVMDGEIRCWLDPLRFDKIDWAVVASSNGL
jgi:hypothetical protein